MKKLLVFIMIFVCALGVSAQTQWYKGYQYSQRYVNTYGNWTSWSDWSTCNIPIKFDLNSDVITIYSKKTQIYKVYKSDSYVDSDGETVVRFYFIDQDLDYGHMRLMIRSNGASQIYIDFKDISWCYNVKRTQ